MHQNGRIKKTVLTEKRIMLNVIRAAIMNTDVLFSVNFTEVCTSITINRSDSTFRKLTVGDLCYQPRLFLKVGALRSGYSHT